MTDFADKIRTIGVIGSRSRDRVQEGRRPEGAGVDAGQRCKSTTDELGATVTESSNRQDVAIRAPYLKASLGQKEIRSGQDQ